MEQYATARKSDKGISPQLLAFLKTLPKTERLVRFFVDGDGHSVYGDDALLVSRQLFRSTSAVRTLELQTLFLNAVQSESAIRMLLSECQCRIEVYKHFGGLLELHRSASPGNLNDLEDLFDSAETKSSSAICSIIVASGCIGLSLVDAKHGTIGLYQFADLAPFANLESCIIQTGCKECIVSDANSDVKELLERCDVVLTAVKKMPFEYDEFNSELSKYLVQNVRIEERDYSFAMQSLCHLLSYLRVIGDSKSRKRFSLSLHSLAEYVRMDASAFKALSLFAKNKNQSLFGLLDKCETAQGSRLLEQMLRQPLTNIESINERLDVVETLFSSEALSVLRVALKGFPDLSRIARRLVRGTASLQDLFSAYQTIRKMPILIEQLNSDALIPFGQFFSDRLSDLQGYSELIERTIDARGHECVVRAEFDEGLIELRERRIAIEASMQPELERVCSTLRLEPNKKVKLERSDLHGHFMRVSRADANALRGRNDLLELATLKSGVLFVSKGLKDLSSEFVHVQSLYREKQLALSAQVVQVAATYRDVFEQLNAKVALLDALCSFAVVSRESKRPFVRPILLPMGQQTLKLSNARHPCIEAHCDFVSNSVDFNPSRTLQIVTGANMCGKSTFVRQTAICALLAQIGCFLPCDYAEISVLDAILTRVGGSDSQLKGVSTFMAEMTETAAILRSATRNSLVIVDELGRGTSYCDGFGLAFAIAKRLSQIGCLCFFATHFYELTNLADSIPTVVNLHAKSVCLNGQISLLFRIEDGKCDSSFGLAVAVAAGFPESVVKMATVKAQEQSGEFDAFDKDDIERTNRQIEMALIDPSVTVDISPFASRIISAFQ